MDTAVRLHLNAIRHACERYGVQRLRVFGSVLTDEFDPETSDVDFLVDFEEERDNLFDDYFDLKFELERIVGRDIDLINRTLCAEPLLQSVSFRECAGHLCDLKRGHHSGTRSRSA